MIDLLDFFFLLINQKISPREQLLDFLSDFQSKIQSSPTYNDFKQRKGEKS